MAVKPNGQVLAIREQIIEDPVSGLTLQFEQYPDGSSIKAKLTIYGNVPYGSRELLFDAEGENAAAGTATSGACRASWLQMAD